jgi:16S rRNA (guanine(966)-N(2))-methyltransferase RsmD
MRISGGIAKGRRVGLRKSFVKKGEEDELRPTSAKVRQAIFNIIGDRIIDASFLDLYAGTGAVGIEALSRGAGKTVFVDDNSLRVNVIKEVLEKFGLKNRAKVIKDKASNYIKKSEFVFDIIFVDPPYASDEINTILPLIDETDILSDNGVVIAEHSSKKTPPFASPLDKGGIRGTGNLRLIKTYRYGDTSLTLYRKESK